MKQREILEKLVETWRALLSRNITTGRNIGGKRGEAKRRGGRLAKRSRKGTVPVARPMNKI